MTDELISIRDLSIVYRGRGGSAQALREVSLDLYRDETLGLIGESGSGKTTLALAVLRMLPTAAHIPHGKILYHQDGRTVDVFSLDAERLRRYRGEQVAMVFQSALSSLNPVLRIWDQFLDTARAHGEFDQVRVQARTRELLSHVQLEPGRVLGAFPHELSGGMRQRVMLALALLLRPRVVVLDEPTTALDILTQRTIIDLLRSLRKEFGFSMMFISHDLSLAAELADRVATMYAGRIVEIGTTDELFYEPRHPYTVGLLQAVPTVHGGHRPLQSIPGSPPDLQRLPSGCKFHPRCKYARPTCAETEPDLLHVSDGHRSACFFWDEVRKDAQARNRGSTQTRPLDLEASQ
ncbi:MAG TPA: ABC transporter ATP-binding protein [bacterium]|nr:ABC transporter ATP-binding protein [bacterium]